MPPLLRASNLSVSLEGRQIIEDLSFEIERGDNVVVIGPNGSGKTVLLRTLLGVIPHEGRVEWHPDVRLSYVPQKVDVDRHLPLSTSDLLQVKATVQRSPASAIADVVRRVDFRPETLDVPLGRLSGGQFQKALIAFALLGQPNVLLFDEPTASLDQLAEEHIYELIRDCQQTLGMTIVLVSHDISVVYRYATKVLCLNHRGLCFGPPRQVLTPDALEHLFGKHHVYTHGEHS